MSEHKRKYLDCECEGGRLDSGWPYSESRKPDIDYTGKGNRNISPPGEGNLNGRPAAMDPANTGKGDMNEGVAFRTPMDGSYDDDYLIAPD